MIDSPASRRTLTLRVFRAVFLVAAVVWLQTFSLPAAAELPPGVLALMKKHRISPSRAGIIIHRIGDNTPLVSHRPDKQQNPASIAKLPLTFAAFDILGPAHTWETAFAAGTNFDKGKLNGNLYFIGGGDPYITIDRLLMMANDLRSRGLRTINGSIIIDGTKFQLPPHKPAAFDGKPLKPYNAGAGAAVVNFSAQRVVVVPQNGTAPHVFTEPPNANFIVRNNILHGGGRCRTWRRRLAERYRGNDNKITLSLRGRFAKRCGEQSFFTAPLTPEANAAGVFGAAWRRLGGMWSGKWASGKTPDSAVTIAVYESPPLSQIAGAMNKHSNNIIARNIFLSLQKDATPATPEGARAAFNAWMRAQGVTGDFYMENGSGLSRKGRMSPAQLAGLMEKMWVHPLRSEILSSLPILGMDGTLRKRLAKKAPLSGHLKTGSLSGVKNIAGYLHDAQGRDIIFICFMKKTPGGRAKRFQDALMLWALKN